MPESCPVSSSHERSRNTAAPATRQTHTRNIAFASPPHTGCTPRSRHTQSPYPDLAAAQSARASPLEEPPLASAYCANRPLSSRGLRENMRETESERAWLAPRVGTKARPRGTSDAYCASGQERKRRSAAAY